MGKFIALSIVVIVILGAVFFLGVVMGLTMAPIPDVEPTAAGLSITAVSHV